jgi:5'-phosphate synthase pdxT subunit
LKIPKLGKKEFPAIFIRAPIIENIGEHVEILAKVDEKIVMVQNKNLLVSSFHPELSDDNRIHNYFLKLVDKSL